MIRNIQKNHGFYLYAVAKEIMIKKLPEFFFKKKL